jgi:hypothetical protein
VLSEEIHVLLELGHVVNRQLVATSF